jgi:hypothetical protein
MSSTYNIDWNNGTNSFEKVYPLFLQNKNVSPEEFSETMNFLSERVSNIQKTNHTSEFLLWFFLILGVTGFFSTLIFLNFMFNNTESLSLKKFKSN